MDMLNYEYSPMVNIAEAMYKTSELINPFSFSIGGFNFAQIGKYHNAVISSQAVDILKIISFLISVILVCVLVYTAILMRGMNKKESPQPTLLDELAPPKPAPGGAMVARWEEISRHLQSNKEAEWKFAVIEADKLLDLVFQKAGFAGASLGEKLTNLQDGQIQNLQDVWDAHKIRNRIAHDVNHFLRYSEAKQAILSYEKVMQELGAI